MFVITFFSFSKEIDTTLVKYKIDLLTKYNNYNIDSAIIIRNELENSLEQIKNNTKLYFTVNNQIAINYSINGDNLSAYKYFNANLNIDTSKLDLSEVGSIYNNAGIVSMDLGQFENAKKYFLVGLKYRTLSGDESAIAATYNNLGLCSYRQDNSDDALEYYFEGIEKIQTFKKIDTSLLSMIYGNVGLLYLENRKLDSAEKYLTKSLKYADLFESDIDKSALFSYF
jgi:Tfp pilus assembly protein PilF